LDSGGRWSATDLDAAAIKLAAFGKIQTVQRLLKAGANPRADADRTTMLMAAAQSNLPNLVALLLKQDRRMTRRDGGGQTALHYAVRGAADSVRTVPGADAARVVEMLLAAGAQVDAIDKTASTPLIYVGPRADIARVLIAHGADVNHANESSRTALIGAASFPDTLEVLLDNGANPNHDPRIQVTPILLSAQNPELARLLIKAGANVNARDKEGNTVLAYCPHISVVYQLLRAGADPMLENAKGKTVLDEISVKAKESKCSSDVVLVVGRAAHAANRRR
jgi:ankyrin repeat protein